MTHDQLCDSSACGYCECILIAATRTQIAANIEALRLDPRDHCIEEYNAGLTNAARIARGES